MIPKFEINLDLPPEQRWIQVINYFKKKCLLALDDIERLTSNTFTGKCLSSIASAMAAISIKTGNIMYKEEIESIANILGVSSHKVLLSQLIYELNSACTTIVVNTNGKNKMLRTMDWDMKILKKLTCELEFTRNYKTVFKAVSWAGYLGILTAMVPNKYSLAVNYRRSNGTILTSIKRTIGLSWPIGYLCRHLLEKQLDYNSTKAQLEICDLVSPCYFIMCNKTGNSNIIIRDCSNCKDTISSEDYLIQTNKDPGLSNSNILFSKERELLAEKIILENKDKWKDSTDFLNSFLVYPIINEETVYTNVLIPEDEILYTIITPFSLKNGTVKIKNLREK